MNLGGVEPLTLVHGYFSGSFGNLAKGNSNIPIICIFKSTFKLFITLK